MLTNSDSDIDVATARETAADAKVQCTSDIVATLGHPFLATYIQLQLATISDLNIIEYMYFVPGKVTTISEWPL